MILVWVVVVIFVGDTWGLMTDSKEYRSLTECQQVAGLIAQVAQDQQARPAWGLCVARKKEKESL